MDKPDPNEVGELFDKLFPWPEGTPLAMPRFGQPRLPSQAQTLPGGGAQCDTGAPRFPLALACTDDELGIRVDVIEQDGPQGIEIWGHATATKPGMIGKAVSVAIGPQDGLQVQRETIRLDTQADNDCARGSRCFGTSATLRELLGDRVTIQDVFLLD